MTMSRNQLKAARMLLGLSQKDLASLSDVGVVSLRRYETGHDLGAQLLERLRDSLETAGVVLIDGGVIGDREIGGGVALRPEHDLPPDTRARVDLLGTPNRSEVPRPRGRPEKRKVAASNDGSP